jgi:hypothetical protein
MRYAYNNSSLQLTGNFNDVLHHRLFFGRNDAGNSVINAQEFRLWENGVGATEKNISTNAVVTLNPSDSSQDGKGGTIPNAQSFAICYIGILVQVSSTQATTPRQDDSTTSIDITPVQRVSPIPLVEALSTQCTFELWKNASIRLERGVVNEYPSTFGMQGSIGGSQASVPVLGAGPAQAAYTINSQQLINTNALMFRPLTAVQVLESLDQFYGSFQPRTQIDLASTFLVGHVDFYLVGLLSEDDKSRQFVADLTR